MASGRQRLTKGPRPNTTGRPDKRYGARNAAQTAGARKAAATRKRKKS
jgi:hypothetical protein